MARGTGRAVGILIVLGLLCCRAICLLGGCRAPPVVRGVGMISELGLLPLVFRVDAVGEVANGGASGLPAAAPVNGSPTALPSPGGGVEIWDVFAD